jgi:hypothetical protein
MEEPAPVLQDQEVVSVKPNVVCSCEHIVPPESHYE